MKTQNPWIRDKGLCYQQPSNHCEQHFCISFLCHQNLLGWYEGTQVNAVCTAGLHHDWGTLSSMNWILLKWVVTLPDLYSREDFVFIILDRRQTYILLWRDTTFSKCSWKDSLKKCSQCLCLLTCRNARDPWRIVSSKAFIALASSCSSGLISLGKDWKHLYHICFPWCCRVAFPKDPVSLSVNGLQ